ncbi:phage holin family protein [Vibrio cholerae]|uniref:phage holin family protein n=1 Tax=Vibrio cholerae TaxID=666 RepID=UPI0020160379|nr:phage holin family protein [Vibrio cholerae]
MPLKEPESWTQLQSIGLALMAIWGGLVTYIIDIRKKNRPFRWVEALMQIIVSGFAGALCALAAMYFEWPQELAGLRVVSVVTLARGSLPFLSANLLALSQISLKRRMLCIALTCLVGCGGFLLEKRHV